MLSSQIASETSRSESINANFDQPGGGNTNINMPRGGNGQTTNYLSSIDTSTSPVVFLQLLGIGLILTILSSAGSVIVIMRYEPLKILSNRS